MIQFNLLPDVKLEYMRAKRLKTLMTTISILVASVSIVVALILLFTVAVVQKNSIKNLDKDISVAADKVKNTPNINRILTVQNQLQSLSAVHYTKPAVTRFFDYISRVTPSDVTLSSTKIDFVGNSMTLTGQATDLLAINRYIDTLKFTTFLESDSENPDEKPENPTEIPAFTQVLLAGFATDKTESTFQITFAFNAEIFNNQKQITLIVPDRITTRSEQSASQIDTDVLFKASTPTKQGESNE